MDLVGPLTPSRGYKYILTITDAFTRYTELVAIPDKETTTVAKELLDQWILRHGFYEQVISDHGGGIRIKGHGRIKHPTKTETPRSQPL